MLAVARLADKLCVAPTDELGLGTNKAYDAGKQPLEGQYRALHERSLLMVVQLS